MDENTGQQPEQNDNMKRVKDFADKLKELGLDMNLMFDLFGGIAENAIKKSEQTLSGLIETKVKLLGDNLAGQVKTNYDTLNGQLTPVIGFVKQIQEQAGQMQQPGGQMMVQPGGDIPAGPGLAAGGGMAGGKPDIFGLILQQVLPRLMGGGAHTENTGMEQMIKAAQGYGEFVKAIMAPITEMQTTMRQSLLQEMQTYSKTGGSLPWDADEAPPQRRQVAQLNQRHPVRQPEPEPVEYEKSDYSKEAAEWAKTVKFKAV
jgi:hypothetical protein